jgi:hypothetical protein
MNYKKEEVEDYFARPTTQELYNWIMLKYPGSSSSVTMRL